MDPATMRALALIGARIRLRELTEERAAIERTIESLRTGGLRAGRYARGVNHWRARPQAFKQRALKRCRTEYLLDVARDMGVRDFVLTRWCREAGIAKLSIPQTEATARMLVAIKDRPPSEKFLAANDYERRLAFHVAGAPLLRAFVENGGQGKLPEIVARLGVKATTVYGRTYGAADSGWIERYGGKRSGRYRITASGLEALAADAGFEMRPEDRSRKVTGRPTSDRSSDASRPPSDPPSS